MRKEMCESCCKGHAARCEGPTHVARKKIIIIKMPYLARLFVMLSFFDKDFPAIILSSASATGATSPELGPEALVSSAPSLFTAATRPGIALGLASILTGVTILPLYIT